MKYKKLIILTLFFNINFLSLNMPKQPKIKINYTNKFKAMKFLLDNNLSYYQAQNAVNIDCSGFYLSTIIELMKKGYSYDQAYRKTIKILCLNNESEFIKPIDQLNSLEKQIQQHGQQCEGFLRQFEQLQTKRVCEIINLLEANLSFSQASFVQYRGITSPKEAHAFFEKNHHLLKKSK